MTESFRGFTRQELDAYEIREETPDHWIIPVWGRAGIWYERTHCEAGCHPKYSAPRGSASHLYNPLGLGPQSPEVWLAEGEFDTLSLVCAGIPAVGILGADNFKEEWWLLYLGAEIVLALDPDPKGRETMDRMSMILDAKQNRYSIFDPSPYSDLNEWFEKDRRQFEKAVLFHGL